MDGESGPVSYKLQFANSVRDNDLAADDSPEVVLFERGMNDVFDIELIIGGTFENPLYSSALRVDSRDFSDLDFRINTTEIGGAQRVGVAGFDLNDWGVEEAFGFRLTQVSGGPDIAGFFASGEEQQFGDVPVPVGGSVWLLLVAAVGGLWRSLVR